MDKSYILDANILIEDESCIVNLRNGQENNIYIPNTVIEELDKLKDKKPQLKTRIFKVLNEIEKYKDEIEILYANNDNIKSEDNKIINEIL
ncbi:MAG: PIN domain-containing protein [archaeon]